MDDAFHTNVQKAPSLYLTVEKPLSKEENSILGFLNADGFVEKTQSREPRTEGREEGR